MLQAYMFNKETVNHSYNGDIKDFINNPTMKKDEYDTTSTIRSARMALNIKDAGGAVFTVRFKTAAALAQLDGLIAAGIGTSRNDVLLKLVEEKSREIGK